jgi:ferric-dicitrate binding protein FerR (iron transport regulator)
MDTHQVKELLQRYQQGKCTHAENELIINWYQQLMDTGEWQWSKDEKEVIQKVIEARIMNQINERDKKAAFYLRPRFQWWAAASVILLLTVSGYFVLFHKQTAPNRVANVLNADIKSPQSNKAMITLSNGQKVYLDSVGNGTLAIQGNVKLVKLANGKISYQYNSGNVNTKIEYNTLSNPRGSKVINTTLVDGSKVWLNAGSSLTYPVTFIGKERNVAVTGEAYFEVARNASMPFIVKNGSMEVKVLGTSFNVNTFKDDGNSTKVTLLEGSVRIISGNVAGLLKPGQQAVVTSDVRVVNNVDLDQVMAWKNGFFQFDDASLQTVLKQVARWYDVDVVYEGNNQPRQFVGAMQRDLSLSELLKILEKNNVHFKIEGKKLKIMSDIN